MGINDASHSDHTSQGRSDDQSVNEHDGYQAHSVRAIGPLIA